MSSSKPRTPPGSPPQPPRRHSRGSSLNSTAGNQHAPTTPSRLSQSHHPGPSPSASREVLRSDASPRTPATIITAGALTDSPPSQPLDVEFHSSGIQPVPEEPLLASTDPANVDGLIDDPEPDAETRLLEGYHQAAGGRPNYHHGWISPRPATYGSIAETMSIRSEENSIYNFGGRYRGEVAEPESLTQGLLGNTVSDGVFNASGDADNGAGNGKGRLSTTKWLAKRHGVKTSRRMYLAYYLPFTNWVGQYQWEWLKGDLVAAITMASFYIPMALSYAENLGHVPPINGLYSFVFNPIIYAILGTCPLMVVGPEAAGSLLVGGVIRSSVDKGESGDDNGMINARIAGVVTGMAGAIIFMAGLTRLGFLDNVLSRPFLRGFISAIGFVIFIDQLIPETGLVHLSKISHSVSHGSTVDKIMFLFQNIGKAHALTCWVSFGSFAIIMVLR